MSNFIWKVPSSWVWAESLDVCESVRDGTHDTPHYVNGGIPLVTSKNLVDGKICFKNVKHISIEDHREIEKRSAVEAGDVLIAMIGTIGNPVVVEKEFDFSIKNIGLFKKNEDVICPYYLKYWLDSISFVNWLKPRLRGTTQKFASLGLLRSLPIPLSPVKEQHRIVAKIEQLFSELDKGIESLKKAREQLKVYRQAVLKHAFEGKLTEQWRKDNTINLETAEQLLTCIQKEREEYYEQKLSDWKESVKKWESDGKEEKKPAKPRRVKELHVFSESEISLLPELPEKWSWIKVDKFCEYDQYAIKAGPFGSALKKEYYVTVGYKVYGQEQVISGDSKFGDYYVNFEKYQELSSCAVKPFDVLISLVGTVGKVLVLPKDTKEGVINPRLVKISINSSAYLPEFFKYYFESAFLKSLYKLETHGATMDVLNLGIIQTLPFPFCDIKEQQQLVTEIESKLSVIENQERDIENNLSRAETLRHSILNKAFSGQLVEQDPSDESASVLLERIKVEKEKLKKLFPKKKINKKKSKKRKVAA